MLYLVKMSIALRHFGIDALPNFHRTLTQGPLTFTTVLLLADSNPKNQKVRTHIMTRTIPYCQELKFQEEEKSRPVALVDLKNHCEERSESSNMGFDEEFRKLKQVVNNQYQVENCGEGE